VNVRGCKKDKFSEYSLRTMIAKFTGQFCNFLKKGRD